MTCVIPADAILDLLELPEVQMKRSEANSALKPPRTIIAETAKPQSKE
jgi:hypothetical protein